MFPERYLRARFRPVLTDLNIVLWSHYSKATFESLINWAYKPLSKENSSNFYDLFQTSIYSKS